MKKACTCLQRVQVEGWAGKKSGGDQTVFENHLGRKEPGHGECLGWVLRDGQGACPNKAKNCKGCFAGLLGSGVLSCNGHLNHIMSSSALLPLSSLHFPLPSNEETGMPFWSIILGFCKYSHFTLTGIKTWHQIAIHLKFLG